MFFLWLVAFFSGSWYLSSKLTFEALKSVLCFLQKWLSFCVFFSERIGRILAQVFLELKEFYQEAIKKLKAHYQVLDNFWQLKAPLKTKKNATYFTIKARSFTKIFNHFFT